MRNRNQTGRADEAETGDAEADVGYETALGQLEDGRDHPVSNVGHCQGEASPGTLEQGGALRPTASPFHSDKVHAEVELLNRRPVTLDSEAQRVYGEINESGLGDGSGSWRASEPPYGLNEPTGDSYARVARVEQRLEQERQLRSLNRPLELDQAVSNLSVAGEAVAESRRTTPTSRVDMAASLTARPEQVEPRDAVFSVLGTSETETRPLPGDTRELVPAKATEPPRMEFLLTQIMEENRLLRARLEQYDTQSSRHSGRTQGTPLAEVAAQGSPVSLMHRSVGAVVAEGPSRALVQDVSMQTASGFSNPIDGVQGGLRSHGEAAVLRESIGHVGWLEQPSVPKGLSLGKGAVGFAYRGPSRDAYRDGLSLEPPVGFPGSTEWLGQVPPRPIPLAGPSMVITQGTCRRRPVWK